jgi:hypothetical protein
VPHSDHQHLPLEWCQWLPYGSTRKVVRQAPHQIRLFNRVEGLVAGLLSPPPSPSTSGALLSKVPHVHELHQRAPSDQSDNREAALSARGRNAKAMLLAEPATLYRRTSNHGLLATHCVAAASFIVDAALCYVMVSGGVTYAPVISAKPHAFLVG